MSAGQYAIGSLLVLLVLKPLFDTHSEAGALIEMSFAGGHGTLAGLTPVLQEYGVEDLLEVGLGLATIGMVTGIVVGTTLVNYAIKSPSITVARQNPTPQTKTSTSIITCPVQTTNRWTSGRG